MRELSLIMTSRRQWGKTSVGSGPRGTARGVMSLQSPAPFLAVESLHRRLAVSLSYFGLLERLPDNSKPPAYHWLRNTPRRRPPVAGSGHPASLRLDGETGKHPHLHQKSIFTCYAKG